MCSSVLSHTYIECIGGHLLTTHSYMHRHTEREPPRPRSGGTIVLAHMVLALCMYGYAYSRHRRAGEGQAEALTMGTWPCYTRAYPYAYRGEHSA
jgi:hypothetical protein